LIASLRLAVAFLTIVPVRMRGPAPPLGAAAAWFPVVGAAIGALAGAAVYLAAPQLSPSVAAVLAATVLVVVTGALHLDGLADCADGLGVRGDREQRLAVMRDPAIGTFGALAMALWLLALVAALAGLEREDALRALVVAAALGRWAALVHAKLLAPARRDGLGAGFAVGATALALATATIALTALVLAGTMHGIVVLAVASIVALLVSEWARRGLGGRTGDTLGATVAITEVAVVVALLGLAGS
jgi:adenosylcobinamide-GDP ribazoletransferase